MLVAIIMMAHRERNSWSKLLTFASGSQAEWPSLAPAVTYCFFQRRICIGRDYPRRLTGRTKLLCGRGVRELQCGRDGKLLAARTVLNRANCAMLARLDPLAVFAIHRHPSRELYTAHTRNCGFSERTIRSNANFSCDSAFSPRPGGHRD